MRCDAIGASLLQFTFDALQLCCRVSMARCVVCPSSVHLSSVTDLCIVAKRQVVGVGDRSLAAYYRLSIVTMSLSAAVWRNFQ